jgi:hypothetical protein
MNTWNSSEGRRSRSNRNGSARTVPPNRLAMPAIERVGYWVTGTVDPTYHPPNRTNIRARMMPSEGKGYAAGIRMSIEDSSFSVASVPFPPTGR